MKYKIYILKNVQTSKVVYVGMTSQLLEVRLKQHRNDKKRKDKYKYLQENPCQIELITEYDDFDDAKASENRNIIAYETRLYGLNLKYEATEVKQKVIHDGEESLKAVKKKLTKMKKQKTLPFDILLTELPDDIAD